jgi:GNAT superfamily N-acetyltransferase
MPSPKPFDISRASIRRGTKQQGGDWTFRAFYGSRRIGYLMVDSCKLDGHPPDERAAWKASVAPEFQREGVATKLYDAAEVWLKAQELKLVPGLESPLHSISDDAYKFWASRAPNHPAVLRDARRFEDQYSGKPFPRCGETWTIEHTAGRDNFILRNQAGDRTTVVRAHLVWDIYGRPGDPAGEETKADVFMPSALAQSA